MRCEHATDNVCTLTDHLNERIYTQHCVFLLFICALKSLRKKLPMW
jgi:hypothetical protein